MKAYLICWYLMFLYCPLLSFAQGGSTTLQIDTGLSLPVKDTRNWVRVWEAANTVQDTKVLLQGSLREVHQSTTYLDGLGRPVQTVGRQGSLVGTAATDLVIPVVYDQFGREQNRYLPYAASSGDGLYKDSAVMMQERFYASAMSPVVGQGESFFYSATQYEPSPVNRVLKTLSPGKSWVGAGRGVAVSSGVNSIADSVRCWKVVETSTDEFGYYRSSDIYSPGTLAKTSTTDESGKMVVEYKDKQSRVVLKKVQGTDAGWLNTYYIYDDLDRLRAVLPPKAVEEMQETGSWAPEATMLGELIFRYAYDEKGRMTRKKVPGAGAVFMVYDARDRLVMTQDANMRGKWLVTVYDDWNRAVQTGLWGNDRPSVYHQARARDTAGYPGISNNWELLTETHYDDYEQLPPGLVAAEAASRATKGLTTWSRTRVLTTSSFLSNVSLYDDRSRIVQTQSQHYAGGTEITTHQYDFTGKVLESHTHHQQPGLMPQQLDIATRNGYDDLGRLISIEKNIDNTGWTQTAVMEYDALGQLQQKRLAPSYKGGLGLETLTYSYNIRGWLLGINSSYLRAKNSAGYADHFFGFELGYDNPSATAGTLFSTPAYNGNISGTVWKSAGDEVRRKYDFSYDAANRFAKADFTQNIDATAGIYSTGGANFSVHGLDAGNGYRIAYDANGNMRSMVQHGIGGLNPDVVIDALHYSYYPHSNKLQQVRDDSNDKTSMLGDFSYDPATKTSTDYGYDLNGNLVTDLNKKISGSTGLDLSAGGAITYNHLNLPALITVEGKGTIEYLYDASGNKLAKTVHETGKLDKRTLYLNGMVYEDEKLQFLSHEEGRIRPRVAGYSFDYFLKDHLGNVRMVLTDEQRKDAYRVASLEEATLDSEKVYYQVPEGTRINRTNVPGYPQDDHFTTPNDYVQRLNGQTQPVGTSILLKVMSGDRVSMRASSWYRLNGAAAGSSKSALPQIVASLLQGLSGAGAGKALLAAPEHDLSSAIAAFLSQQKTSSPALPKSSLNWLLLDEQLKPVLTRSGSDPVGTDQELKIHTVTETPITRNGYLYIYLSNLSPDVDVFFDNLQVTHTRGPILEETHYYPFGLIMAGISSKAAGAVNKRGFNGGNEIQNKEFSDGSGIEMYDAVHRMYDPQLGRFWQVDKLADVTMNYSPYVFANDNPILFNDPLGLLSTPGNPQVLEGIVVTAKKKNSWNTLSYASTAAWVDRQRAHGYNDDQINAYLEGRHLDNQARSKFNDAMTEAATNIREAEAEYWKEQEEVAKLIAWGMVPMGEVGGLVGKIGGRIINAIGKSGGKVLDQAIFYRAMSNVEYAALESNGYLSSMAGKELFISTSESYCSSFLGKVGYNVIVKFNTNPGTLNALSTIGVRNGSQRVINAGFGSLPKVTRGWMQKGLNFFKGEGEHVNIGLGSNPSVFNSNIIGFSKLN